MCGTRARNTPRTRTPCWSVRRTRPQCDVFRREGVRLDSEHVRCVDEREGGASPRCPGRPGPSSRAVRLRRPSIPPIPLVADNVPATAAIPWRL